MRYLWVTGVVPPKKASKRCYWEEAAQYIFETDNPANDKIEAISRLWYSGNGNGYRSNVRLEVEMTWNSLEYN